jgi:hypothetical protein
MPGHARAGPRVQSGAHQYVRPLIRGLMPSTPGAMKVDPGQEEKKITSDGPSAVHKLARLFLLTSSRVPIMFC